MMGYDGRDGFGDAFEALLAAACDGAPWAWQRLYDWLSSAVAGYLRVQGVVDVDDVASEVWLGVFRGIGGFEGSEAQFRSWVFVIAHRRLSDQRRRIARDRLLTGDDITVEGGPPQSSAEDEALHRLTASRVEAVCGRLVPDQRDVMLLRIVADLTIEQIAVILGKSEGAVKALQRRGLEVIRKIFSGEGVPL